MEPIKSYDNLPPGCKPCEINTDEGDYGELYTCCGCNELTPDEKLHDCDDCDRVFCRDCMVKCKDPQCDERICLSCSDKQWGYCGRCLKDARERQGVKQAAEPLTNRTDAGAVQGNPGPLKITPRKGE